MSDGKQELAKQIRDIIEKYSNGIHDSTQWFQEDDFGVRQIEPLVAELMAVNINDNLLAACKAALAFWYSDHPNDTSEADAALRQIEAAIARAEPPKE